MLTTEEADEEQVWLEVYALARILRDIGLIDLALQTVAKAHDLLKRMGLAETYAHRLDLLELQIRQRSLRRDDAAAIARLLGDAVSVGEKVLAEGHPTAPAGLTLGQLMREARRLDLDIPARADEVFAELAKWSGGNLAELIAATSVSVPSVDQVEQLVGRLPRARYSEDVGYDTATIATLSALALNDDAVLEDPESTGFLLETQADWGTALPGWDEAAAPPVVPSRQDPAAIAAAIANTGTDILQLGFDADGRLVRLLTSAAGTASVAREDLSLFSQAALRDWSAEFPRRYGLDDSANLFYTTTDRLQLSVRPEHPIILVAGTDLQAFPPNILFADGEFLGRRQPVAAVPSLAWLKGAQGGGRTGDGRHVAWISAGEGESGTLALLAQLLGPTLGDHDFALDTGPTLPQQFAGATMAIVTAHGGVHPEGRYFQVVSDEGRLRVSSGELAAALRNVAVVVLFVCSGGRADKHPGANTTLGLAKQILDRGSRAVIASPWPLDSQVPPNWLPIFLDHWQRGATLMAANFAANAALDQRYSLDPARGLAMSVYGDGLMTKP